MIESISWWSVGCEIIIKQKIGVFIDGLTALFMQMIVNRKVLKAKRETETPCEHCLLSLGDRRTETPAASTYFERWCSSALALLLCLTMVKQLRHDQRCRLVLVPFMADHKENCVGLCVYVDLRIITVPSTAHCNSFLPLLLTPSFLLIFSREDEREEKEMNEREKRNRKERRRDDDNAIRSVGERERFTVIEWHVQSVTLIIKFLVSPLH